MATIKKHGSILAELVYLTHKAKYMSDGNILKNEGDGWKLFKKWKAGVDPAAATAKSVALHALRETTMPDWCEYRRQLVAACPLKLRWKMHATIGLMPDDADGVWSTMDDYNHHFDVGEIVQLCAAYRAMMAADVNERAAHQEARKARTDGTATTALENKA